MLWSEKKQQTFIIIVSTNDEYVYWPVERQIPAGWKQIGKQGTKNECLDYIEQNWLDIRSVDITKMWQEIENNPTVK